MASSSSEICSASVSYKKTPGRLTLTQRALSWTPSGGANGAEINIANGRMNALFCSKEGGTKVMLRVAVLPASPSAPQVEDTHNFTFIAGSSAISDREHFKKVLSEIIVTNRKEKESGPVGEGAVGPSVKGKERAKESNGAGGGGGAPAPAAKGLDSSATSFALRKLVLNSDPALALLHRELVVVSGDISEAEFWDGREDLLLAAAAEEGQRKGRSGEMVDPKPETGESGEITVKITPALIREIFEEYPAVLKAYNENVPEPLDEQQFWTRYFQSKLFNRNRTTNRAAVNTIKDDAIFDQYLGTEDDELEPKNLHTRQVYRLLDLAATEDDQHEVTNQADVTMRAGGERASLPLIRRFNEHSERLLNQSLGAGVARSEFGPAAGNAGERNAYYDDIILDDLTAQSKADRIVLNLQERPALLSAGVEEVDVEMDDAEEIRVLEDTKESFEFWEPHLGDLYVDPNAMEEAVHEMAQVIRQKLDRNHDGSGGIPDNLLRQLTTIQASANELLRQFWIAVLPPKPNDISAAALSTPAQKAARAQRMKGYLDRTEERIVLLFNGLKAKGGSVEIARVEAALEPVREALHHAVEYFTDRTS